MMFPRLPGDTPLLYPKWSERKEITLTTEEAALNAYLKKLTDKATELVFCKWEFQAFRTLGFRRRSINRKGN